MSDHKKLSPLETEINDVRIMLESASANMATGDITELGRLDSQIKNITDRAIEEMANLEDPQREALIASLDDVVKAVTTLNKAYQDHPVTMARQSNKEGE